MKMGLHRLRITLLWLLLLPSILDAQQRTRARELGVPFDGTPGTFNAITDVPGVEVGHTTIIAGDGALTVARGPVRTGVTAILPRGKTPDDPVFAAWSTLNGNGEMTGTTWVEESGFLEGPVMLTNTLSVGTVRDAVIAWRLRRQGGGVPTWSLPVVAETWDGFLNDIAGFHVNQRHVFNALDSARSGAVLEGNVGGGTGMVAYQFKGGIGTSSRLVDCEGQCYVVGALVQANYGTRSQLIVAGVPVGKEITELMPTRGQGRDGSIIVVLGTDAPLIPHQLKRLAKRVALGIARNGGTGNNSSGDIFVAFSTANARAAFDSGLVSLHMLPNDRMNPLFAATIQAVEEAVVNALVAAETMRGVDGNVVHALPHRRLQEVLKKYNRLAH